MPYLPERIIGKICNDFDGIITIWGFLISHSRSGSSIPSWIFIAQTVSGRSFDKTKFDNEDDSYAHKSTREWLGSMKHIGGEGEKSVAPGHDRLRYIAFVIIDGSCATPRGIPFFSEI